VPDEWTVRKLTRRLGAEVVHEITREVSDSLHLRRFCRLGTTQRPARSS
jgi:hypothetical protein